MRAIGLALLGTALFACASDRCESYQTRILYSYAGSGSAGGEPGTPCFERRDRCKARCASRCVQKNGACDTEQAECLNFCEDGLRFCEAKQDMALCQAQLAPGGRSGP